MAKQTFTTGQVLTAAQMTSLQQTAMLGGAASAKTASYTLVAADAGSAISMSNASATTITVNTALFAAGDTVHITNLGAGVCTITAGTATVNSSASLALAQYESGFLDFTSTSAAIFVKGAGAAAAAGANPTILSSTASRYITPVGAITDDVIEVVEDRTYYIPIFLTGLSFNRISIRTSSTYSGTSSVRLGLFNCDLTTGKPSTVAFDAGTVSTTAANTTFEITISQTPVSGYYFFAFNAQTISANPKFSGITIANNFQKMLINSRGALSNGSNSTSGYIEDGVTGAFATASGVAEITGDLPIIGLRTA